MPVFSTGCGTEWPHRTTSRLLTIAALRSGSSSTTFSLGEHFQGVLDHPNGPLDDPGPGGDDRPRLLPLEHRRRDLGA